MTKMRDLTFKPVQLKALCIIRDSGTGKYLLTCYGQCPTEWSPVSGGMHAIGEQRCYDGAGKRSNVIAGHTMLRELHEELKCVDQHGNVRNFVPPTCIAQLKMPRAWQDVQPDVVHSLKRHAYDLPSIWRYGVFVLEMPISLEDIEQVNAWLTKKEHSELCCVALFSAEEIHKMTTSEHGARLKDGGRGFPEPKSSQKLWSVARSIVMEQPHLWSDQMMSAPTGKAH